MLNTPRICVVVIGKTLEEFLSQLEAAQTAVDFVELRIDYLEQINPNWVRIIKNHTHKKSYPLLSGTSGRRKVSRNARSPTGNLTSGK